MSDVAPQANVSLVIAEGYQTKPWPYIFFYLLFFNVISFKSEAAKRKRVRHFKVRSKNRFLQNGLQMY